MTEAETEVETVESPVEHITVTQNGSLIQVQHNEPDCEAGFDLTDFGNSENFAELLATFDLSPDMYYNPDHYDPVPDPQYSKVDKRPEDPDRDYGVFVWANRNVALITGNNPLTGEYSNPDMRQKEEGYASYIGISGEEGAVREIYDAIKQRANHIKGEDPEDRQFI